jgi:hypothetical protein
VGEGDFTTYIHVHRGELIQDTADTPLLQRCV